MIAAIRVLLLIILPIAWVICFVIAYANLQQHTLPGELEPTGIFSNLEMLRPGRYDQEGRRWLRILVVLQCVVPIGILILGSMLL